MKILTGIVLWAFIFSNVAFVFADNVNRGYSLRQLSAIDRNALEAYLPQEFLKMHLPRNWPGIFLSPGRVKIGKKLGALKIGKGTVVYPGVTIAGTKAVIGRNAELLCGTNIQNSELGNGSRLEKTTVAGSSFDAGVDFLMMEIRDSKIGVGTKGIGGSINSCTVGKDCDFWFGANVKDSVIGDNVTLGSTVKNAKIGSGVVTEHADSKIIDAEFPNIYPVTDEAENVTGQITNFPNCTNVGAGTEIIGPSTLYTVFTAINTKVTGALTAHFGSFLKGVLDGEDVPEVLPFSFAEGLSQADGSVKVEHRIGWVIDSDPLIIDTFISNTQELLPAGHKNDVYKIIQSALCFGKRRVEEELEKINTGIPSVYSREALDKGLEAFKKALVDSKWRGPAEEPAVVKKPRAPREFKKPKRPPTLARLMEKKGLQFVRKTWPGVEFRDPESTIIDGDPKNIVIGAETVIGPDTILEGNIKLGPKCAVDKSRLTEVAAPEGGIEVRDSAVFTDSAERQSFNFVEEEATPPPSDSLNRFSAGSVSTVLHEGVKVQVAVVRNSEMGKDTIAQDCYVRHSVLGSQNKVLPGGHVRMSKTADGCVSQSELTRTVLGTGSAVRRNAYSAIITADEIPVVNANGEFSVLNLPNPVRVAADVKCANYSGRKGGRKGIAFAFLSSIEPGTNIVCRYGRGDPGMKQLPAEALKKGDMTVLLPFSHVSGQVWGVVLPGTIADSLSPKEHRIAEVFDAEPLTVIETAQKVVQLLPEGQKHLVDTLVEDVLRLGIRLVESEIERARHQKSRYTLGQLQKGLEIYKRHLDSGVWKMQNGKFISDTPAYGYLFMPRLPYEAGKPFPAPTAFRFHRQNTPEEVRQRLEMGAQRGTKVFMEAPARKLDGPTSSHDLPTPQDALAERSVTDLDRLPCTVTFSGFPIRVRFEPAGNPDDIEYVSVAHNIPPDKPFVVKESRVILTEHGRTPNGAKDCPAYILGNILGLRGVRAIIEEISPFVTTGGLEGSDVFSYLIFRGGVRMAGANLNDADLAYMVVASENAVFTGAESTGGQGVYSAIFGGAYLHTWLSGIKTAEGEHVYPYAAFSQPLLTTDQIEEFNGYLMFAQAGKEYVDGKAVVRRTSDLANEMWTDLLKYRDEVGHKLWEGMLRAGLKYATAIKKAGELFKERDEAIKANDWKNTYTIRQRISEQLALIEEAVDEYTDVRDGLCLRWLNLMLDSHQGKQVPEYAHEFAARVFDKNNPRFYDYEEIRKLIKDPEIGLGGLRKISPYSLDPIATLIRRAREQGISMMPLGAGGPGTTLLAFSRKGAGHIRKFFDSYGLGELTEERAYQVIHAEGDNILEGYMPASIGGIGAPVRCEGFDELGFDDIDGPLWLDYNHFTRVMQVIHPGLAGQAGLDSQKGQLQETLSGQV